MFFSGPAFPSDKTVFVPAAFGPKKQSVIDKIKFPETDRDVSVNVYCEAQVSSRGEVALKFCFTAGRNVDRDDFSFAVARAFHRVRIFPAHVDRKRLISTIQFMVKFVKSGTEDKIALYPNFELNSKLYGFDYSAPQYYWERDRIVRCENKINIALSMIISESGKPEKIEVLNKDLSQFCKNHFISIIESRKYIPAFHDGEPVKSRHIEYLNVGTGGNSITLGLLYGIVKGSVKFNTN